MLSAPVTLSVPLDTSEDVAVIEPPVNVFTVPVTAVRTEEKRLVDVAFVVVRLVNPAVTALSTDEKRLVNVAPVAERLVVDALVKGLHLLQ